MRVRLALIDAISSNPGVIVPWEALTKVFKSKGIIRCVVVFLLPVPPLIEFREQPGRWSAPDRTASCQPARICTRLLGI